MKTTAIGRKAESVAKVYLEMRGFRIIEQNYRRPNCEIDIIAQKNDVIHFVEVKYRAGEDQNGGLEAITSSKLKKMRQGAYTWVDEAKWRGHFVLSAVEVSGRQFTLMAFTEDIV